MQKTLTLLNRIEAMFLLSWSSSSFLFLFLHSFSSDSFLSDSSLSTVSFESMRLNSSLLSSSLTLITMITQFISEDVKKTISFDMNFLFHLFCQYDSCACFCAIWLIDARVYFHQLLNFRESESWVIHISYEIHKLFMCQFLHLLMTFKLLRWVLMRMIERESLVWIFFFFFFFLLSDS